jgi:hypothetical protein
MACEKERALVDELQKKHADAQFGCNSGLHGECARAADLQKKLTRAQTDLQRCLHPAVPPPAPQITTDVRLDQVDGTFWN